MGSRRAEAWERLMDSLAPYKIFRVGSEFVVKNNSGEVKARFSTRSKALAYLRALYANVPGAPGKAERTPWTGTAKPPAKKAS